MRLTLSLLSLCFLAACQKEKPPVAVPKTDGSKVLVLCEGNFQWGNADFDLYLPDSNVVYRNVYKAVNGQHPGDVLQSALLVDGDIRLVLNNSGSVVTIDKADFTFKSKISNLGSPRYLADFLGNLVLTDLYSGTVTTMDKNGNKRASLYTGAWTEEMLVSKGKLWVTCRNGYVYTTSDGNAWQDSIFLKKGCSWGVEDKNGKLWFLATDSGKSSLFRLDVDQHKVESRFDFAATGYAQKLAVSRNKDTVFCISGGLMAIPINASSLPASPVFEEKGANWYGLGVDPNSGIIYLANAKDFVSKGEVVMLQSNGAVVRRFACGINPGGFLFYR
jgi:hypothetical protein